VAVTRGESIGAGKITLDTPLGVLGPGRDEKALVFTAAVQKT